VVGVVAWITLVPLFDLLRNLVRAASAGAIPGRRMAGGEHTTLTDDQSEATQARIDRAA
jgi:hypothetical protein